LIEAKYLEPFMRINYVESEDSFYYRENDTAKNATQLDYQKTINALVSLYNAAKKSRNKATLRLSIGSFRSLQPEF
jgi:hypothetical protein